ncbi:MAG: DUF4918 family protein [Prolixibacteraceae bacterium]|nr:DUF4918 family protein [Prolixibacteraceae bacterium]NLX29859.1 SMUG2 DNA glycosylase family protein [Bacteroidales bacterium]HOY50947.1 DUF4918 family protein [Prolixibacteraceae bacterium]
MTLAEKIIRFNASLSFEEPLPEGIRIMNPYRENPDALRVSSLFYRKYYTTPHPRRLILGINPGRLGAGVTGIPFTDTYRLKAFCGLEIPGLTSRETSSAFVYDMISAYGGPESFYQDFLISATCPLGFVKTNHKGTEVNFNYYDDPRLQEIMTPFILRTIEEQLGFGLLTDRCYCLGSNKNYRYLLRLNQEKQWFGEIIPLEHPRFIMQYRLKQKESYIGHYLSRLKP